MTERALSDAKLRSNFLSAGFRDPQEIEAWQRRDPIDRFRTELLDREVLNQELVEEIAREAEAEMRAAEKFAEESEFPDAEDAFTDLYA